MVGKVELLESLEESLKGGFLEERGELEDSWWKG
jgi:hypothetical protein